MNGETVLILGDLRLGLSVKDIAVKYKKSENNIRAIAKRYNVALPERVRVSEDEKKTKKQIADAKRYLSQKEKEEDFKKNRPDVPMPFLPLQAAKLGGLGQLNDAWALKQSSHRSTDSENAQINRKYGLKFPC